MEKGETESSSFRRPLSDFNSPLRKIRHPPPPRLHYHHGFCRSLYPLCPPLPPSLSLSRSLSHFARVYVRVYLSPSLRPPPLVSRLRAPRKMLMLYWWQRWSALTVLRASAAAAAPHKKKIPSTNMNLDVHGTSVWFFFRREEVFGAARGAVTLPKLIYRGANTGGKTKTQQLTPNYGFFFPLTAKLNTFFNM